MALIHIPRKSTVIAVMDGQDIASPYATRGQAISAPLTDNEGEPLKTGAIYYNTEVGTLFYYTGIRMVI